MLLVICNSVSLAFSVAVSIWISYKLISEVNSVERGKFVSHVQNLTLYRG